MPSFNSVDATIKGSSKRSKDEILRAQLELERSTFRTHWRDLSDFILPRRSRFFISDANKGDRRNQKIIDSTATLAARTLQSGMMSGITSPSRPWFKLKAPRFPGDEFGPVRDWLTDLTERMNTVFTRSNLYNVLPTMYGDLGTFGTAPIYIEEDFDRVIHIKSFPVGSYMIAKDEKDVVNTFFREFRMTVQQLVEMFGLDEETGKIDWDNISEYIRSQWDNGQTQIWVDVCHIIHPNPKYDPGSELAEKKRFRSAYYEKGVSSGNVTSNYIGQGNFDKYLRESGHDFFPVLVPRWETTGEDVYGTNCPGMVALGDIKALQTMHRRKAQAVEKMVNPPMIAPPELRSTKASILPGDITYSEDRDGQLGFRPAHEVRMSLNELRQDINEHQRMISRAFYEDLFLMLVQSDRRQITATEIEERHEEKLLALGPVLERLNQDLLDPLIDITFDIMVRQELVPEPPEELQGEELKVEYVSIMAEAQKLVGLGGLERFTGYMGQVAQFKPDVLDKFNGDQAIDVYGEMVSINPDIIRTDDETADIREQRAIAQQQQAQMEQLQAAAGAAKDLSNTDLESENALKRLVTG